jgi:gluconate 5-dehydrogenase
MALDMFSLNGKTCVVTGAAGGLGSAITEGFAAAGAQLLLIGRHASTLEPVRDRLPAESKAQVFEADVTNPIQVHDVVERLAGQVASLDVLVNLHGINVRTPTEKMSLGDWQRVLDTNLKGTFLMCQEVGRMMIRQRHGKIINMSSTAGAIGYPWGYSAYSPSKAAIEGLTRTLAVEWGPFGINVNAVAPFFVRTKLTEGFLQSPGMYDELIRLVPLGRLGAPQDVVGITIFLASPASDWVTGQVMYVDGGRSAL